ncbi:cardiolipin synthase B [filamentous cyanobacterium CCP1]|nr:cardiolipin synthase B [filamentous cyanobacterium CCP2]PSB68047.1 cardiolipin synthase B [filamentous cyanobacterium CCP1]
MAVDLSNAIVVNVFTGFWLNVNEINTVQREAIDRAEYFVASETSFPLAQQPEHQANRIRIGWWVGGGVLVLLLIGFGYLYLRGVLQEEPEYIIENVPSLNDSRFPLTVIGLSDASVADGILTGFWSQIDEIQTERLKAIGQAKSLVQYETFFMTEGQRANDFAEVVIERARAGVTIQLLFDDRGTSDISQSYWQRLRDAGIEVRFFRKFDWQAPLQYNSRTHRKLLLIDGQQALIGGAGISDDWDGRPEQGDTAPWLDFEVRYEGAIVSLLQGKFLQNWAYAGGTIDLKQKIFQVQESAGLPLYVTDDTSALNTSYIRMLFQISFLAAQTRIWIGSPYFIPDPNTRRALIRAKERGVDVRILTMGNATDKPLVHFTSRELYGDLLKAGIKVCEHQPSMMHAKFLLVDSNWVSTGSANFDPRSYFHNDELNISSNYPELIAKIDRFFTNAMNDSHCLTHEEWQARPWKEKLSGQVGLMFKNLL